MKTLIILVLITLNSIFCIKSKEFCSLRQNEQECNGLISFKCRSSVCASSNISCAKYKQMNLNLANINKLFDVDQAKNYIKQSHKITIFNKHIKKCDYKYEANDFCLNRRNCTEKKISPTGLGYKYINFKVDCKCPSKQSFI